ncbi:hypothetical protein ACJX0J_011097, partial [Zea mays]
CAKYRNFSLVQQEQQRLLPMPNLLQKFILFPCFKILHIVLYGTTNITIISKIHVINIAKIISKESI